MVAYSLARYAKLVSGQLTHFGISAEAKFQVSLLTGCAGYVVGRLCRLCAGWGESENKAKLSPAGAGTWAELGNNMMKRK